MSFYDSVAFKATDIDSHLSVKQDESEQQQTESNIKEEEFKCLGCDGLSTTRLSCPTCISLGILSSIFCSQGNQNYFV